MKTKLFMTLLLISNFSFAGTKLVTAGQPVSAKITNNIAHDIGDIRSSLLTESQFQARNGSCWVLINGQSVSGSSYAEITGKSSLPSAAGHFLRNIGGNAPQLGALQGDAFQDHGHPIHSSGMSFNSNNAFGWGGPQGLYVGGSSHVAQSASVNVGQGVPRVGAETRPQNLGVNMFVKINECEKN